ncbi:hypothetical protein G6F65_015840 [Rhizopus arrhizus]|nr:hypothetical protein G6F65_015840 [Rhizopus arrhizus]
MRHRIQLQAAHVDHVVGQLGRAAAQHGLDAGHQLFGRERLGDVVVGAGLQAVHLVLLGTLGGQHDDRDGAGALVVAQLARHGQAGRAGQHPIQQDQIGEFGADQGLGLVGVEGAQHFVPRERQVDGDQFLDCGFVFDNEDSAGHGEFGTLRSAGAARTLR